VVLLYFFNLIVAVFILLAPFWWSRNLLKLDKWNPINIITLCYLPVQIFRLFVGQLIRDEGLMDPYYNFAVFITNLRECISLLLLYFTSRLKIIHKIPIILPKLGFIRISYFPLISKLFFVFFIITFLMLAIKTGGVVDWLSNIRSSYMLKRDGNGLYYAAAINFLSISFFFAGIAIKDSLKFSLLSLLYYGAVYILGSKGYLLNFFIFYIIIIWRQRNISVGWVLIFFMPLLFILILYNFYSNHDYIELVTLFEYFDHYPISALYYKDYFENAISLYNGEIFFTSFWHYVPRQFFPEKPYVYGILYLVEFYFPGGPESGNTPSFTDGVSHFADFGIFGVLFFSIFNPIPILYFSALRYALLNNYFLQMNGMSGRTIIICLLLFAPMFGVFLPILYLIIFLFIIFIFIRISILLKNSIN